MSSARLIAVLAVAIPLLAFSILKVQMSEPIVTPDSRLYLRIADNLRLHGCLSESDPARGLCVPTWGSQPPGYPLFLAALRSVGGGLRQMVTAQVILFAGAALWLALSVPVRSRMELAARVTLFLVSPLTLAWGRWLLTETLATAATMAAFAVFAGALYKGRVNLFVLISVLLAGMLLRWDQILLVLPALALLAFIYPWRAALPRALVLIVVVAIPYTALSARAMLRGLPWVPVNTIDVDMPPGVVGFWRLTALDQRATSQLLWPSWSREYARVRHLELEALSTDVSRTELVPLLDRLSSTVPGTPFPAELDKEFTELAGSVAAEHPLATLVGVPLVRSARIWTWPDRLFLSGWSGLGDEGWENWRTLYRILLLLLSGVALMSMFNLQVRRLSALLFLYLAGRTCFLAALTMLETRYLVEAFPVMELLGIVVIGGLIAIRDPR